MTFGNHANLVKADSCYIFLISGDFLVISVNSVVPRFRILHLRVMTTASKYISKL